MLPNQRTKNLHMEPTDERNQRTRAWALHLLRVFWMRMLSCLSIIFIAIELSSCLSALRRVCCIRQHTDEVGQQALLHRPWEIRVNPLWSTDGRDDNWSPRCSRVKNMHTLASRAVGICGRSFLYSSAMVLVKPHHQDGNDFHNYSYWLK